MTQPSLSSLRPRGTLALVAVLAWPALGAAQDDGTTTGTSSNGDIDVAIVSIAGESPDTVGTIWINLEHCRNDVEIEFELDGVPDRETFDIYVGAACNTSESRDRDAEGDCTLVRSESIDDRTQDVRIRIGAAEIIRAALGTDDCGSNSSKPNLWFLAVDVTQTSEAVQAADYGRLELNVDTDPPDAPTSIRGGRGENEIPVSWNTSGERAAAFEIFVDPGEGTGEPSDAGAPPQNSDAGEDGGTAGSGATNPDCGTGALREGASADSVADLRAKREGSATATSTTLSPGQVGGDLAAVAVVSVDEAGNKSTLSEVGCLEIVPTTGLKDLVEQNRGEYPQGCPCAATGPAQLDAAWPIGLALTLLAYRRRQRS